MLFQKLCSHINIKEQDVHGDYWYFGLLVKLGCVFLNSIVLLGKDF